jgi:hypothetical protein
MADRALKDCYPIQITVHYRRFAVWTMHFLIEPLNESLAKGHAMNLRYQSNNVIVISEGKQQRPVSRLKLRLARFFKLTLKTSMRISIQFQVLVDCQNTRLHSELRGKTWCHWKSKQIECK